MGCDVLDASGFKKFPISHFHPEFRTEIQKVIGNDSCIDSKTEYWSATKAIKDIILGQAIQKHSKENPTEPQISTRRVTVRREDGDVYEYTFSNLPNQPSQIISRNTRTDEKKTVICRGTSKNSNAGRLEFNDIYEIASNGKDIFVLSDGRGHDIQGSYIARVLDNNIEAGCEFHSNNRFIAGSFITYMILLPDYEGLHVLGIQGMGNSGGTIYPELLKNQELVWWQTFRAIIPAIF